jgi:AraC-like DNA-binding protein
MHVKVEAGQPPVLCPFPPTPLQFVAFYLDDPVITQKEGENTLRKRGRCIVVGPQTTRMNLLVQESHRCFVIAFKPCGLYRLLGIPMKELFDDGFEGTELVGPEMKSITEQLQETHSFSEMIYIVENFLLHQLDTLKSVLPIDAAMEVLIRHDGLTSIDQIASLACLSLRQFERKCHERLGYSPKFFARVVRFSKAYRLREMHSTLTWTAIAHEAGYYDQMHFIRDFKQFAGVTPTSMAEQFATNPFPMQAPLRL